MKKNSLLLYSMIVTVVYFLFAAAVVGGAYYIAPNKEVVQGMNLVFILFVPHILIMVLALLFNLISYISNSRTMTLITAVIYVFAMVAGVVLFIFVIPQVVMCIKAFKNWNREDNVSNTEIKNGSDSSEVLNITEEKCSQNEDEGKSEDNKNLKEDEGKSEDNLEDKEKDMDNRTGKDFEDKTIVFSIGDKL